MRHRFYDLLWISILVVCIIGRLTLGGEGWAWIAAIGCPAALRSFTFVLQQMNYSLKMVGRELVTSTDGESFKDVEAVGVKDNFPADDGPPDLPADVARPIKGRYYPETSLWELGTASWGLTNKWGGNEHGFLVANKDLVLDIDGNKVILADIEKLPPHKAKIVNALRQARTTERDRRYLLPDPVWNALGLHTRFNIKKAPVFVGLEPLIPVITADRLGNPRLYVPKAGIYSLQDLVPKDSPVLDLRPEMRLQDMRDAKAAREWAAKEIERRDRSIQNLEARLAYYERVVEYEEDGSRIGEAVMTAVAGPEESGGRQR